jgi:hypothetical protein
MKSKVVGWPSVVTGDLVRSIDQKICESQLFTISKLHRKFHTLFSTRLSTLGKPVTRWLLKILTGVLRTQRMSLAFASTLTSLE